MPHDGSREPSVVGVRSRFVRAARDGGRRRGEALHRDSRPLLRLLSRAGIDDDARPERRSTRVRLALARAGVGARVETNRGRETGGVLGHGGGDGVAHLPARSLHDGHRRVLLQRVHDLLLEVRERVPSERGPRPDILLVKLHDALVVRLHLPVVHVAVGVDPPVARADLRRAQTERSVEPRGDRGGDLASGDVLRRLRGRRGGSRGRGGGDFRSLLLEDVPQLIEVVLDKRVDVPVRLGLEQDDAEGILGRIFGPDRLDG